MNKMKISLCSLAVTMAIGLSSSAFAVNNDLNPLTGAPANPPSVQSPVNVAPQAQPGVSVSAPEQLPVVSSPEAKKPSVLADKSKEDSDDSYDTTEDNLKKATSLNVAITVAKLEKELKDIKNPPKEQNNNTNNGSNPFNGQSFNQNGIPQANNSFQQTAPVVAPVVKKPETTIQATAVYSLGNATYAELYVNGNKFVATKGSPLPNGYKLVGLNDYGVTLKKGNTKIELPIVSAQTAGKTVATQTATAQTGTNLTPTSPLVGQTPQPFSNGQAVNVSTTPPAGFGPGK